MVKSSVDLDCDPRAIVGTREFDAPRELVFAAFTDAKHLAEWGGPNGFTTTTISFDMRPGGRNGVRSFVLAADDADYSSRPA
jgi:uncharacterized protein YndB with AHSA1/START domain